MIAYMLSVDGDVDAPVEARVRRQLVPLLTNKDENYTEVVCIVVCYMAYRTWPVKKENKLALHRAEMRMIRWMRGCVALK